MLLLAVSQTGKNVENVHRCSLPCSVNEINHLKFMRKPYSALEKSTSLAVILWLVVMCGIVLILYSCGVANIELRTFLFVILRT